MLVVFHVGSVIIHSIENSHLAYRIGFYLTTKTRKQEERVKLSPHLISPCFMSEWCCVFSNRSLTFSLPWQQTAVEIAFIIHMALVTSFVKNQWDYRQHWTLRFSFNNFMASVQLSWFKLINFHFYYCWRCISKYRRYLYLPFLLLLKMYFKILKTSKA